MVQQAANKSTKKTSEVEAPIEVTPEVDAPEPDDGPATATSVEAPSAPDPDPVAIDLDDSTNYLNRELSLLEFQRRVLNEAEDPNNRLLERVKFLSIVASNLDEFMMVRVAGLRHQVAAGVGSRSRDGRTPAEALAAVRKRAHEIMDSIHACLNDLLPQLDEAGIHILKYEQLTQKQRTYVDKRFEEAIFPALTPLAFDPGRPFPHISNLSLNLAVLVRGKSGDEHFARVKIPRAFPRLLAVKASSGSVRKDGTVPHHHSFVWLEDLIIAHLSKLFPGMEIIEVHRFHVTRDADFVIQELEAFDLLERIEQGVRTRRFGSVVSVTVPSATPSRIRKILMDNLSLTPNDVYTVDGPLALSSLMALHSIERWDLKDPTFKPAMHADLRRAGSVFEAIAAKDILIHRPYQSFAPFLEFLRAAAEDPDVLAIKQTLYRTGQNSPVVAALLEARERGKQVTVLVELKARFDEESNILWARALEREGVHVVYGLLGLKTHSKLAMVVRKEGDQVRRYVHMSTGNYNAVSAGLYTDISLFTAQRKIGSDVTDLFNYLTGYSAKEDYHKLLVAPISMRQRLVGLIQREIEHQQAGIPSRLIFKMNALVDPQMIKLLYEASAAGVIVDLLVRGICCLRPGVPGLSENIRVISVVGRFLEHSRIYYFRNAGNKEVYLGSADLMPRNLDHRVEVLFPLEDADLVEEVRRHILGVSLADNTKASVLLPDGSYERVTPEPGAEMINSQLRFMEHSTRLAEDSSDLH